MLSAGGSALAGKSPGQRRAIPAAAEGGRPQAGGPRRPPPTHRVPGLDGPPEFLLSRCRVARRSGSAHADNARTATQAGLDSVPPSLMPQFNMRNGGVCASNPLAAFSVSAVSAVEALPRTSANKEGVSR